MDENLEMLRKYNVFILYSKKAMIEHDLEKNFSVVSEQSVNLIISGFAA